MNTETLITLVIVGTILFVMVTLFIVLLLTSSQKRIIKQQNEMFVAILETQEKEQQRIGSDLHDSLGPHLSATKVKAGLLEVKLHAAGLGEQKELTALNEMLDSAVHAIREASHDLMPPAISNGLNAALAQFTARMSGNKVEVKFIGRYFESTGNLLADTNIFRIAQELIYNAIKHADASLIRVFLGLDKKGNLNLRVTDNGSGNPEMISQGKGIGINNIKNRLKFLGGTLKVCSNPKGGICCEIVFNNPCWK